jgi:hypothetical protein
MHPIARQKYCQALALRTSNHLLKSKSMRVPAQRALCGFA